MESNIKTLNEFTFQQSAAESKRSPTTSGAFLRNWVVASALGIGALAGINVWLDIFGLFHDVHGRALPVYHQERASKYLLSYSYIPQNFKTIIVGTSLSDNLDVGPYNQIHPDSPIYNASIMGGSITEVSAIANKAIEGGIKNVIFCISPYQLKESGFKEMELNKKMYYSALGSKNLYETYVVALIRKSNLLPEQFPEQHISAYGTNFFTDRYRVNDVAAKIREVATALKGKPLAIDSAALQEFSQLVETFRSRQINVIAYFHPLPAEMLESNKVEHLAFQDLAKQILNGYGTLIDFNDARYQAFSSDYSNYIDNGHLSEKGQAFVTTELLNALESIN
jgi:hypothetical protein